MSRINLHGSLGDGLSYSVNPPTLTLWDSQSIIFEGPPEDTDNHPNPRVLQAVQELISLGVLTP